MSTKVFRKETGTVFQEFLFPEIRLSSSDSTNGKKPETENPAEVSAVSEAEHLENLAKAEEIIENAHNEASQIIAQAEAEKETFIETIRQQLEAEFEEKLQKQLAEKLNEFRENFSETVQQISSLREEISAKAEKDLVELALEIAKKIVGREVNVDREIAMTLAKVSLKKINSGATFALIHLNPEDFAYFQLHREQLHFHGSIELVEDRSVSAGGCLIHTETGDVDARIESQFEEISYGLLGK